MNTTPPVAPTTTAATTTAAPTAPVCRPGISATTLAALGIRHVTADEAMKLVGLAAAGICIPFPGVTDNGAPYYRLRLDTPTDKMKYHQRKGSGVHNYIPVTVSLYNGTDLVGTEGEFKAIACGESGIHAFGTSGFYSWRISDEHHGKVSHAFERDFGNTIQRLSPKRIVFVGDADTALNSQFSDAMVSMAKLTGLPVILPRIPYDAPNGKGLDDIRDKLGNDAFLLWFGEALRNAEVVNDATDSGYLSMCLLKRETAALQRLQGEAREKAKNRLVKLASRAEALQASEIAALAKTVFDIKSAGFNRAVTHERREAVKRPKEDAKYDETVFERLLVVGERFYAKTWDLEKSRWSESFSPCEKDMVEHALRAAAFIAEEQSDEATPVCGMHRNLSKLDAAFYYLHANRVDEIVDQLFQPFGRKKLKNGKFQFNNSSVVPPAPMGNVNSWADPKVAFTAAYLRALLGDDQLDHFTSVLSYTYTNARARTPRKPLALFFIGAHDVGKSLAIDCLIPLIHGQTAAGDAHRLIMGENGGSAVLSNYVCKLSDKELGDQRQIKKLQSGMLALLADHTFGGKLMYQNVTVQEVFNLFAFSCNRDGSALGLLKGLPESIRTKMAVYNCGAGLVALKGKMSDDMLSHPGRELERELPYVCSLLTNWAGGAVAIKLREPRFGVRSYFAPGVEESFERTSEESTVFEALLGYEFRGQTATYIFEHLSSSVGGRRESLADIKAPRFREVLHSLARQHPGNIMVRKYDKNTLFDINGKALERVLQTAAKPAPAIPVNGMQAVVSVTAVQSGAAVTTAASAGTEPCAAMVPVADPVDDDKDFAFA